MDTTSKIDVSGQGYLLRQDDEKHNCRRGDGLMGWGLRRMGGAAESGEQTSCTVTRPEDWGSGGGGSSGGPGGGLVRITADTLAINGKLLSNGSIGPSSGGGGSGGGIYVAVNRLLGAGEIGAKAGPIRTRQEAVAAWPCMRQYLSGFNQPRE